MAEEERKRRRSGKRAEQPAEEEPSPLGELEDVYDDVRQQFFSLFSLPEEFTAHMRAARREVLLALRALIDARIASLEEGDRRREATRRTHVQID